MQSSNFDVIIVGGGAAGLLCAYYAGLRGKKVLVIERANKVGKKILMSGGGRCNFTNLDIGAEHYVCNNPHFVKSALAQYTQWDFIALVEEDAIPFHEKAKGQLFCDNSSKDICQLLSHRCQLVGVAVVLDTQIQEIVFSDQYRVTTHRGVYQADSLVIASGGLSIPTLGGSGFAYEYAKSIGLRVNPTRAGLVPFTFTGRWLDMARQLSGISLPVVATTGQSTFVDDMLFTHRGLSGPAMLQLSNYWALGDAVVIDLFQGQDVFNRLLEDKEKTNMIMLNYLSQFVARAVVQAFVDSECLDKRVKELSNKKLQEIVEPFNHWRVTPSGTEGYRTAEVTLGGVDVSAISSKTMAVKKQPSLFFIGEALDVTGQLGGYNFQWAWSSGYVAAQHV